MHQLQRPAFLSLAALLLSCTLVARAAAQPQPERPTFEAPKEWKVIEGDKFAVARFQIGAGERIANMTITPLAGEGGGLVANINRWRTQLGLKPLENEEAVKTLQPVKVDGIAGHALEITGPKVDGKVEPRILVTIVRQGDQTWFFRLSGPADVAAEQKTAYEKLLKSVRFPK